MTSSVAEDPATHLTVIVALAATFVAVGGLYLIFKLTDCLAHLFIARTRRRIARSCRFLTLPHLGRVLRAIDIGFVIGLRSLLAIYIGFLLLFIAPILLTIGSLDVAAALVVAPGH